MPPSIPLPWSILHHSSYLSSQTKLWNTESEFRLGFASSSQVVPGTEHVFNKSVLYEWIIIFLMPSNITHSNTHFGSHFLHLPKEKCARWSQNTHLSSKHLMQPTVYLALGRFFWYKRRSQSQLSRSSMFRRTNSQTGSYHGGLPEETSERSPGNG